MELVRVSRRAPKRKLHLLDGPGVEQVAELLDPHQLAEELAVERERLRATLLRWRVVLVHVRGDVLEEKRCGERRCRGRLDLDQIELPRLEPLQDPAERREIEDVLQALAIGLENDRKLRVTARDLKQALGLQALLPKGRPLTRTASRDEQGTSRVLAEPRTVERALRELHEQEILDLLRVEEQIRDAEAARRRPGSGGRFRRLTTGTARRCRGSRAGARGEPSPRARAPDRRTA